MFQSGKASSYCPSPCQLTNELLDPPWVSMMREKYLLPWQWLLMNDRSWTINCGISIPLWWTSSEHKESGVKTKDYDNPVVHWFLLCLFTSRRTYVHVHPSDPAKHNTHVSLTRDDWSLQQLTSEWEGWYLGEWANWPFIQFLEGNPSAPPSPSSPSV